MPHDQCPMATAVKKQQAIRGLEAVAERPDGTRVPFLPFPTPIFNASGVFIGAVNMLVDITSESAPRRLRSAWRPSSTRRMTQLSAKVSTASSAAGTAQHPGFSGMRPRRLSGSP